MPLTVEGRLVVEAIDRPGAWSFGGVAGVPVGVDFAQVLAALPAGIDIERAKRFLPAAEAAYLTAWREHNKDQPET